MRSPGYAMVLQWISEIWDELDSNLIACFFDNCGITSSKLTDSNNQLRHFVRTTEFVDEVQPDDSAQNDDLFEEKDDETQTQTIIDSESEEEIEHEEELFYILLLIFYSTLYISYNIKPFCILIMKYN